MVKKPVKKSTPTPEYDSQRETRVLLEQMNKSITTVAEQHESVVKRLDDMATELHFVKVATLENSNNTKILKDDVKIVKKGQEQIKQKLDVIVEDHSQRIEKLEAVR
jgi:tetrahydromethanopterin S-methyltransferase subunit G